MKLYFRYIAGLYLKNCIIFILAFVAFYVFVDLLINYKKLHINTNIFLLYLAFTALTAFYYILPIAQILAMLFTKISLIKKSELIAFYSLGLSKNASILPVFLVSIMISFFASALNYTNVAYAEKYKANILKTHKVHSQQNDLFFKYNGEYFFIKHLDKNVINDIRILNIKNGELQSEISAKMAIFDGNSWQLQGAVKKEFLNNFAIGEKVFKESKLGQNYTLANFNPQFLQNISTDASSLKDALIYLKNFSSHQANARLSIYKQSVFLFFAPFLSLIIFYRLPIMPRFSDLNITALLCTFVSLLVYGGLFLLLRFSQNAHFSPELSVLFPIALIILYSLINFVKNS